MRENLDIFDFALTEEESKRIAQLPQKKGVLFATVMGPYDICLEIDAEIWGLDPFWLVCILSFYNVT